MTLTHLGAGILVVGLVLLWLALRRIRRRKIVSSAMAAGSSAMLLTVALACLVIAGQFHAMDRLTAERDVGTIRFAQVGPNRFDAVLTLDGEASRRFVLDGDQWQIDARFIKWSGPAIVLGADGYYQVDRLSGRYDDVDTERTGTRSVYALAADPGRLVWHMAAGAERWLPWVDASYGSATYLPMADGALYRISVTQSGLLARAANDEAEAALFQW